MFKFVASVFILVMVYHTINVTAEHQCPLNQEYTTCGSACPTTCNPPKEPMACTQQCVIGCRCKKDYVRNSSGDCVLPSQCNAPGY